MNGAWGEPRWLVGAGVVLLVAGYIAVSAASAAPGVFTALGRVAFYGGLVLLVAGVVIWLRRPPRPDPAECGDDGPSAQNC